MNDMGPEEEKASSATALASADDPEATVAGNEKRKSLHSSFPRHIGYISLLFSLGNVALQIFSHLSTSATFLSSIPYERDAPALGIGDSTTPPSENDKTAATCADDRDGFHEWWNLRGKDEFFDYAQACGPRVLVGEDQYFACLVEDYGFNSTQACLDCFLLPIECVMTSCLGTCLAMGVESTGCVDCLIENDCDGPFEACAGVSAGLDEWEPTTAVRMLQQEDNAENDSSSAGTVLYEVYSISFVDSIRDAANGGAWWLVIILVCLSGIWPYLKNVIMIYAWFVPMTSSKRSSLLQWLTRLAKWSLVDVFVIVIICTGVKIDQTIAGGFRFVLVGEPRVGIVTFCLAALWDLSQGEWMRSKHFEAMHQQEEKSGDISQSHIPVTIKNDNQCLLDQVHYQSETRRCSSFGRALYSFIVLAQIAFIGAVIGTICITFRVGGFPESSTGQGTFEYTAITIATALLNSFGTISPGGATAFVGSIFMVVVYLGMCIVLPLFCCLLMASSSLLPSRIINQNHKRLHQIFSSVDILGGFSCLDVWLLAFILCALEFNHLMEGALEEILGDRCEQMGLCISLASTIEIGVYLSIPAILFGWIVEANFTYLEAYFVHPSEMFAPWDWLFGRRFWTKEVLVADIRTTNVAECIESQSSKN